MMKTTVFKTLIMILFKIMFLHKLLFEYAPARLHL